MTVLSLARLFQGNLEGLMEGLKSTTKGGEPMQRITERVLKDKCLTANNGVLKSWPFGLTVDRTESGYRVFKAYRKRVAMELLIGKVSANEAFMFIEGFIEAVVAVNQEK